MGLPEKAIICLHTQEDAEELAKFVGAFGYFLDHDLWNDKYSCADLGDKGTRKCFICDRTFYEEKVQQYDSGVHTKETWFVPEDVNFRFISLDEFVACCSNGALDLRNVSVDVGGLL